MRLGTEVLAVDKTNGGDFDVRVRRGGIEEVVRTRFVVWAAGEFQYPKEDPLPGAAHCLHNSRVRSWAELPGDERVVIGAGPRGKQPLLGARRGKSWNFDIQAATRAAWTRA